MKTILNILFLISVLGIVSSCEKDEGKKPNISYKTGGVYVSSDVALTPTSVLVVGINASKAEEEDPLVKFNISKSVNGGTSTTVFQTDLSGSEGDSYSHDFIEVISGNVGDTNKYTFTVTNRDGLTNQLVLIVTVH
jgi:hypothetical protein